jgi:multimeric flavodoxin WrbA
MKVLAINGSPNVNGNTFFAISVVLQQLEKEGIETEILTIGNQNVRGCFACGTCVSTGDCKCIIEDGVNGWIKKMVEADGIILGSPVYFSGVNGTMKSFLDRAFFVTAVSGRPLRHKVGAAVVAVRRSGGIPTVEQLNKYFCFSEMLMPASNYWNVIHGMVPGEAAGDAEGIQTMRVLGQNMAWLLKLIEHGKGAIQPPAMENKIFTNFIR